LQLALFKGDKIVEAKIQYPQGELIKDKVVGDYEVYKGTVTISATVSRSAGDTRGLEAEIRMQGYPRGLHY
jgi:hypothetical protein